MAAAVSDFKPAEPVAHKLKKDAGVPAPVALEATPDVLAALRELRRDGQVVVGFAAEHGDDAVAYGRRKLADKGLDAIVVNDISRPEIGFESSDNEVVIVTGDGERLVERMSKDRVADAVLDAVERLYSGEEISGARRTHTDNGSRV
jgi:phosphopantothenoylcysteine decarboxylase/phosphopantothenate--cysteine ligase